MLNSHPQVRCFGELFNLTDPSKILWTRKNMENTEADIELRRHDPCEFVENRVYSGQEEGKTTVGFKLFYYHAREAGWDRLWTYLAGMSELSVIHIRRRNQLRRYVSEKLASKTDKWTLWSESDSHDDVTVQLELQECIAAFERVMNWDRQATSFFASHRVLDVDYEDLLADYVGVSDRLQTFFEVDKTELTAATKQQVLRPLSEIVKNYDEICSGLAGTAWADYLSEA